MNKSGIYYTTNTANNHRYIGSSVHLPRRRQSHFYLLKTNGHHNTHLQHAWNKYGESNFKFEILELINPKDCLVREQWYLDNHKPEYNLNATAGSILGLKHSEETKKRIGTVSKGRVMSEEQKKYLSNFFKNRIISLETRKKMSNSKIGHKVSSETREKISLRAKSRDNSVYGKKVNQIDTKTSQVIKTWDSLIKAARFFSKGKIPQSGAITKVCNRVPGFNTAYGFKWEYAES